MNDRPAPSVPPEDAPPPAAQWLLAFVLVASALALGSQHTLVLCAVVAVLAVAAFLAWFRSGPLRVRTSAKLLLVTGVALTVWTFLQTVPLPASVLGAIAPANADVWARALSPLKEPGPAWAPISLDPIATRVQVLRGVAYVLAFLVALRVAHRKEGGIFLDNAILASTVAMALAALLHPAFGAARVFGVYQPVHTYAFLEGHLAPLLNPNHLVGYLNIGTCVGLGAIISSRPGINRILGGACVALTFVVARWEGSRGGTLSILAGVIGVLLVSRAARGVEKGRRTYVYVAIATALLGLGMVVVASGTEAFSDLASKDISKATLAKQALSMGLSFPLFGIGRGAFESVFPAFRQGSGYVVFTHPENIVPQWTVEWGMLAGVLGFVAIAWGLRPSVALERSRPPAGAWGALACLALHNLVDFNSEVPGVMLVLTVCAAEVVGGGAGLHHGQLAGGRSEVGSWIAFSSAGAAVVAVLLAVPGVPHELSADQARLRERVGEPAPSLAANQAELRETMLRHPAEPYFPYVGAVLAMEGKTESPIPWIGRSLERSPVYGRAHLLLARGLASRSPSQARLEYRLALEQEPDAVPLTELPRLVGTYDDAMEVVPVGERGDLVIESLAGAVRERLPATSVRLDQLAIARGHPVAAATRSADRALAGLVAEESTPWCDVQRAQCVEQALGASKIVIDAQPFACAGYALRAGVLVRYGDPARALDELETAADGVTDRVPCYVQLLGLAMQAHDEKRTTTVIDRLSKAGCPTDEECAALFVRLAQVEEARGGSHRALGLYKKASERAPARDDILEASARLQAALGLHAEAAVTYAELARRHPENVQWAHKADAARAAAGGATRLPRR